MTYLLGWKTNSNAYLAADTMVTGSLREVEPYSSFGERQIDDGCDSVTERGLKIVVDGDLAIGMCGDSRTARNLAASIFASYRRTADAEAALHEMTIANGPFARGCEAQLLIAWKGRPSPRLFAFNHEGDATIREARDGIDGFQMGSVDKLQKGLSHHLFKPLVQVERISRQAHLAAALGVLQSYGVHDYLPQSGVGGAFTGVSISDSEITWQPDLFYFVDNPGETIWPGIATCIRDNGLIINSTLTNQPKVIMADVLGELDFEAWRDKWEEFAHSFIKTKRFDYVILLSSTASKRVVVILEMKKQLESRSLKFACNTDALGVDWLQLRGEVLIELRREFASPQLDSIDFRFGFIPYVPCTGVET